MTSDTYDPLNSLAEERDRLDRLLAADPAWRALRQLETLEAQAGAELAASLGDLRRKLEGELAGNKVFEARRRITEAITLLSETGGAGSPALPSGPAAGRAGDAEDAGAGPPADAPQAEPRPLDRVVTIAAIEQRGAAGALAGAPVLEHAAPTEAPPAAADDLTRIRGIDRSTAVALRAIGVARFADVAAWSADDVRRVSAALGLGRMVSRGNWIEQAARLAGSSRTAPAAPQSTAPPVVQASAASPRPAGQAMTDIVARAARQILDRARPPAGPTPQTIAPVAEPLPVSVAVPVAMPDAVPVTDLPPEAVTAVAEPSAPAIAVVLASPAEPAPSAEPEPPADDLTRLTAMDAAAVDGLAGLGITRYAQIAAWTAEDVRRVRGLLGAGLARVSGRWIEEAAILTAGGSTRFARHSAAAPALALAPRPDAEAGRVDAERAHHLAAESRRAASVHPLPDVPPEAEARRPAPEAPPEPLPPQPAPIVDAAPETAAVALALDVRVSPPLPPDPPPVSEAPVVPSAPAALAAPPPAEPEIRDTHPPAAFALALDVRVLPPAPIELAAPAGADTALAPAPQPAPAIQRRPAPVIRPLEANAPIVAPAAPVVPSAALAAPEPEPEPEVLLDGGLIASLDDLPLDLVPDIPEISFGEADVAIVKHAPPADALAGDAQPRPVTTAGGAGTLQSRLRRAGQETEIDARTYAAYHGEVEEASVEIVRRGNPMRSRGASPTASDDLPGEDGKGPQADADGKTVRRFLKALTGQSR